MIDEAMYRLLDYDRRRYWLENGWSIRFRVVLSPVTTGRPYGVKYSFTLYDVDGERLLGFDNAHGTGRALAFDHQHRFRGEIWPYHFRGADELIGDFFDAVERACATAGVAFDFVGAFELEETDGTDEPEDPAG